MRYLTKVITGSILHGLNTPESDTDYRGIFVNDLKDMLSPFKKLKSTSWIEGIEDGDADDIAYELTHFCQMASRGNPSALEVLWSNQIIEDSLEMKELRKNKHKFLNSIYIFEAHKGYAHNQYKKMNLFEPDERTPKFAVAYVRVLQQGIELLSTGDFNPQVVRNKELLYEVKNSWNAKKHVPILSKLFAELQVEFAVAYQENSDKFKSDLEWIENFIYKVYTKDL